MVGRHGGDLVSRAVPEPPVAVRPALRWSALKAAVIPAQGPSPKRGRAVIFVNESRDGGGDAAGNRQFPVGVVSTHDKHAWTWPVEDAFAAISLSPLVR